MMKGIGWSWFAPGKDSIAEVRRGRGSAPRFLAALTVSAVIVVVMAMKLFADASLIQRVAFGAASASLFWSVIGAVTARRPSGSGSHAAQASQFTSAAGLSALLLGISAAVIESIILAMRVIYVCIDLLRGFRWRGAADYGFSAEGLWSLGLLSISCGIALWTTRDRRLPTCLLALTTMTATWVCMLPSPFAPAQVGGEIRGGATALLVAAMAVILSVATLGYAANAARVWRSSQPKVRSPLGAAPLWPGFHTTCVILASAMSFLVCYHLLVPITIGGGGFRTPVVVATASAILAGGSCIYLVFLRWSDSLADAGVALLSLSLGGLAVAVLPAHARSIGERYPMLFSALIAGFAFATLITAQLSVMWKQQPIATEPDSLTRRMTSCLKRFAFFNGSLAMLASALMAIWPRLPGIATMDHSIGRITSGCAANLFWLVVMLRSSRQLRRPTFHILTVLAMITTLAFVIIRMLPFTSGVG